VGEATKMDERIRTNYLLWNEVVRVHARSEFLRSRRI
jgi:hypothetical protein